MALSSGVYKDKSVLSMFIIMPAKDSYLYLNIRVIIQF